MKVLLTAINAKYIHSNLAVYSLRAAAGQWRKVIDLAEYTINQKIEDILAQIYLAAPDLLCFSCYIWNIEYVEALAAEYKKLCPDVPIWLGGPEVSFEVETFLGKHPYIDGVIIGEGEETFRELCGYYAEEGLGKDLSDIPGLAFREADGTLRRTKQRNVTDMSRIPFCYEDMENFRNRIIYYESSRGCPFSCSYCLSSVDKSLRYRDMELVKKELGFFLEQKVEQVKFVDRTFNCDHERVMEIWKFLSENDNGLTNFHFEVSADLLTGEEIELIRSLRPGLIQLEIGVQSVNEQTIREIHRSMKLDRLEDAVCRIREKGNVHVHLDLIAGLPYEDLKSFRNSFDRIFALFGHQLQLGFLKVLKGSYIFEHAKEYGIVYRERPPYEVLYTKWLKYEDVLALKRVEEMLEVYYNSGQFSMTMRVLFVMAESMFDLFLDLGNYYFEKEYSQLKHTRNRRGEILLEFLGKSRPDWLAESFSKIDLLLIKEALVYDLYDRENCKSRPSWAVERESLKQMNRKLCRNGKLSHAEPFYYDFMDYDFGGIQKTQRYGLPKRREKPLWVLFHYDETDSMTHAARKEKVEENEV